MSAYSQTPLPEAQEVLGELLHSVSQPLTTLRCALELSLDEAAERQRQTVSAALEQTEAVIETIRVMREYLEVERGEAAGPPTPLMPVLKALCDELSVLAAAKNVRLQLTGTCTATLPIREQSMRKALEYVIAPVIQRQPHGSEITLQLDEHPEALLRVQCGHSQGHETDRYQTNASEARPAAPNVLDPCVSPQNAHAPHRDQEERTKRDSGVPQRKGCSAAETMRRARLAIAARILENAGAVLTCDEGSSTVVLHSPQVGRRAS